MISICIPARNAGAEFREHLRRWKQQDIQEELEIVVLDSSSTDETVAIAQGEGARVHSIPAEQFNHGESRNRLAGLARGDLLVFTVQDAYPATPLTLHHLTLPLRQDPEVAGVTGKQIPRPDANLIARWETEHQARLSARGPRKKHFPSPAEFARLDISGKVEVISFDNVCSAMRRSAWEEFRFPCVNFGEDLHWSYQVMRAGHAIFQSPAALVHHSHNRSPWLRQKRFFVTRYSLDKLFQTPPQDFPWSEQQAFASLAAFRRRVARLRQKVLLSTNRVVGLRLPRSAGYLFTRAVEKWGLKSLTPVAHRLLPYLPRAALTRHFNFVCWRVLKDNGSLTVEDGLAVIDQVEAQVVGDYLGQCYYRCECLNELSEEFKALGALLQEYY